MRELYAERVLATAIDAVIYGLLTIAVQLLVITRVLPGYAGDYRVILLTAFLIWWLLAATLESIFHRTPGKRILGIGVTPDRFHRLNIGITALRNFLKIVLLPVSLPFYFLSHNGIVLHDHIAGTRVTNL